MLVEYLPKSLPVGTGELPIEKGEEVWVPNSPEDETALKIIVQDVQKAEAYVGNLRLLTLWQEAENLYLFKVPTVPWEGTSLPRASLGMPLVLEHIWSIWPQVMIGLFQDDPPFMSKPRPGTPMEAARANDAMLGFELEECDFRNQLGLGLFSALQYGNGIFKWGWKREKRTRKVFRQRASSKFVAIGDDSGIEVPDESDTFEQVTEEEIVNVPTFECINLRHALVDSTLRGPDIRKAKWVAHVLYKTAEELAALKDLPGYKNIPDNDTIAKLFFEPKEVAEVARFESSGVDMNREFRAEPRFTPSTVDPLRQPLQVIEYWTPDRVYTVVQKKLVIRNEGNPFGVIPFLSFGCVPVIDSFYCLGIAYLIGPEQRLQQGVINGFLDDFSLSLNGMFVRQRGKNVPSQQLRMRPGGVIDVDDDVNKSLKGLERNPSPIAETMAVIAASDARAQRRTAANELVVQGSLPQEKSSITRTATGANLLAGGAGARIQGNLIENIANLVFVPFLEALQLMNGMYMKPSQVRQILSEELGIAWDKSLSGVVGAHVKFSILAAAKLQARRAMAMSLPFILEYLTTEPVMNALQIQGQKVDFAEIARMIFDVSGWPNRSSVIVPMTEEDAARSLLMNPGVQAMMAKQAELQTQHTQDLQTVEEEGIARSGRDVIKSMLKMAEVKEQPPKESKKGASASKS